jgi:hypothetical protein
MCYVLFVLLRYLQVANYLKRASLLHHAFNYTPKRFIKSSSAQYKLKIKLCQL